MIMKPFGYKFKCVDLFMQNFYMVIKKFLCDKNFTLLVSVDCQMYFNCGKVGQLLKL